MPHDKIYGDNQLPTYPDAPYEYGCDAATVRGFLDKSHVVLVAVRVSLDAASTYLALAPDVVRASLTPFPDCEPMPCEWHPATKELVIGSRGAIDRARERQQ